MLRSLSALRSRATKVVADIVHAEATQLAPPPSHLRLLDFVGAGSLERWQLQSDASIGGFSECSLQPATAATAVFSGSIALETDPERQEAYVSDQGRTASKTGFSAMRTAVDGNECAFRV